MRWDFGEDWSFLTRLAVRKCRRDAQVNPSYTSFDLDDSYCAHSQPRADPHYAPAWHNLADLLDESGRLAEAVDCQKRALDADPRYAAAIVNMALILQRLGKPAEAATWWKRYLQHDRPSTWADHAKRTLKYCEMQMVCNVEGGQSGGSGAST